jgi:hypothetical protein
MRSGSSPSDSEAPEACAVRQLPSSTWCVDATLACSFGSSRLINPLIGIFYKFMSARVWSLWTATFENADRIAANDRNERMFEPAQSARH